MYWYVFVFTSLLFVQLKLFAFASLPYRPDFLIILSVYITMHGKPKHAIAGSWFLGMLQDIYSCERFGIFAILFTFLSFLLLRFKEEILLENTLFISIMVFVLSLQCNFLHSCIIFLLYDVEIFQNFFFTALYSFFAAPIVLTLLEKLPAPKDKCIKSFKSAF